MAAARREPADGGFTVLEIVVAMTVLVVALVGAAALFGSGMIVSGNTRNRVVAQQVASQYLEQARGIAADPAKFTTLTAGTSTYTKTVNNIVYTTTETRDFVNQTTTQSTCDSPGNSSGLVLRVREKVTWNGMAGTAPIREATILAAPVGAYSTASGSIAVKVFDSTGAAASGVTVQVAGGSTVSQATTPEGCAFFAFLAAGTYTVSITSGTGVGDQENLVPAQNTSVSVGQTAALQFNYDTAGTINVTGWSGSTNPPATFIPVSVANTGLQPSSMYAFGPGVTALTPLFPYSSGYTAFAGNCTDSNPLGKDTNRNLFYPSLPTPPTQIALAPGSTVSTQVPLYSLPIVVKNTSNAAVAGATVTATETTGLATPYTAVCLTGTATGTAPTLGLATTDAAGNSVNAVPLGHLTITATSGSKQGSVNVWVKPDAVYGTSAGGASTTAFAGPITVTIS